MERAPRSCILCGSRKREPLMEKGSWRVYRCASCGLGFLDPRPSEKEVKDLYCEKYFADQYDMGIEPNTSKFEKRLSQESHRLHFFCGIKKKGRVLDIGCGNAYFLAACRNKGYEVYGLDISDWAARYATQKLGIPVVIGKSRTVELPPHNFDIITMWHFLEHTRNPHKTVLEAKKWLKEDGILIIDVPNYESTDAQKNWGNWVGWQLPYHFYHFTPKTLKDLAEKCGLRAIKTKNYHSETIKISLKRIPIVGLFARLIAKMYSGTSIAMIFR
ncbi:MAG TPA: hypothetical protein DDW42_08035 [Desulfobacteraceae bacterium]|nr:hypothetical protein [Desulfobacteraceae bacterium]